MFIEHIYDGLNENCFVKLERNIKLAVVWRANNRLVAIKQYKL